ncbi:hypothetical protein OEZ85_005938 [Tetradesmus obliquus]|uniref:Serine/threonine-protein phosphatase 4 regulatory subunit 3-like central domain-containing protein n=1 Tax=Tetradesmus obliquus TaxID=3088 RepID=A0ABY8UHD0_TETOB|nr:hypothetical protein OEZ85_005938 [Tetradesmus obliquus]
MEFANHASNSVGLVVIGEETQKMLMVHRILHEDIYNRQDETIITWTDPDIGTDVALSFQEGQGCNAIWQHIVRVQTDADPKHPDHRRRVIDEFDGPVGHLDGDYLHHDVADMAGAGHVELPAAEMANLEEIAKVLAHVPPMQRERVAQLLMMPNYLRKLLDIFRQCEDLEDLPSLHNMFRLMRSIIMLNDTQLLDELLKEEHVMGVIGCLEYDPDLQTPQQHRNFLQTAVVFKEVVPITSQEVLGKIHQTYRIQYLKDVILPRSLDDATYGTLSSLMLFNNVDVVLGLYQDAKFLPALFEALKSRAPGEPDWDDLVAFLQEFCSLAKHLQLLQRQNLWNKMTQLGMFEVITRILQSSSAPVKLRATDILLSALAHDPSPLRSFLAAQPGHSLLDCLVKEFVGSEQSGLPEQIAELLKLLVDPETMEGALEKNDFMDVFYSSFIEKLIAPVGGSEPTAAAAAGTPAAGEASNSKPAAAAKPAGGGSSAAAPAAAGKAAGGSSSSSSDVPASTIGLIVDLLCFCVQHHAFWAKYHVLRKNVVEKVLRLLRRKERWLVVAGVRFLRTCIGTKDDFYMRHLTRNQLLDPVMTAFWDNGERYNLLNSAVLELVEFIRKENIKSLIEYLVEKFGDRFAEVTYVDTFKQLQLKWEQSKEAAAAAAGGGDAAAAGPDGGGPGVGGRLYSSRRRLRRDARDMDRDEEDYFSEDSVEEGGGAGGAAAAADRQESGAAASADAAAAAGGSGDGTKLVIKGLFKPGSSSGSGAGGGGGRAGSGSSSRAAGDAAAAAAAAAPAAEQSGLGLMLVPYGDDDDDDEEPAAAEPPAKSMKGLDGSRQQYGGASPQQQQQQQQSQKQQQQAADSMGNGSAGSSSQQQQQLRGKQKEGGQQQQQQQHSPAYAHSHGLSWLVESGL